MLWFSPALSIMDFLILPVLSMFYHFSVTHRGWDITDECRESVLSVSLNLRLPCKNHWISWLKTTFKTEDSI